VSCNDGVPTCGRAVAPGRGMADVMGAGESLIVGESAYVAQQRDDIAWAAPRHGHVVITGPTGCGKKVALDELRRHLPPRMPHCRVGVPTLTPELCRSELLGHVKGSHSTAVADHRGFVQRAAGGLLTLDDGDKMLRNDELQTVLFDVAERVEVYPVGGSVPYTPDVRLMVMFQRPLEDLVGDGLRRDLAERLDHDRITLLPLSEHREDIPMLAAHMLAKVAAAERLEPLGLRDQTVSLLERHPWPGNVRQLGNVLLKGLKAAVRDEAVAILPKHLGPQFLAEVGAREQGRTRRKGLTEAVVREAIEREDGNVCAAARRLGVSEQSVWYWIRTRGIQVARAKVPAGTQDGRDSGCERPE